MSGFVLLDPGEIREKAKELAAAQGLRCRWPGAGLASAPSPAVQPFCIALQPRSLKKPSARLRSRGADEEFVCLPKISQLQTLEYISL